MTSVAVTGSNGFIGARLVRHLAASGRRVHCLVRSESRSTSAAAGVERHVIPKSADELATLVTSRLDQFAQTVCSKCSVACLARPKTPCSAKFHDDRHPAEDLLHS